MLESQCTTMISNSGRFEFSGFWVFAGIEPTTSGLIVPHFDQLRTRSAFIDIIRVTGRDRDGGEQTALEKQKVSHRGVWMWGVNSTVTKHLDYFVWKDTSERKTRSCDNTVLQQVSEFLCIKTPLFWRVFSNMKSRQKNLEMLSPTRN